VGNLKYFGVALSNEECGKKTLRGNEFGEIHIADS
jgi:hypothetical protein